LGSLTFQKVWAFFGHFSLTKSLRIFSPLNLQNSLAFCIFASQICQKTFIYLGLLMLQKMIIFGPFNVAKKFNDFLPLKLVKQLDILYF
jgi:hypothetical protein